MNYSDNWYRTFRGHPKMSPAVKDMVRGFVEEDKIEKVVLFFTNHCGFDSDYSEFLIRELADGNL